MDPAAVLLERPGHAGAAFGRFQLVEKPGCVRLRHGEQCCEERGIGHRLHGQPVEDGQDSIVAGVSLSTTRVPSAFRWFDASGRMVHML